jgi:tyrosyl-tRNA synthetase
MASRLVARFHHSDAARAARLHFEQVVQRREVPDEVPEVEVVAGEGGVGLLNAMVQAGLAPSNSEARRLVAQGAVRMDDVPVADPTVRLEPGHYLVRAGKRRFALIRVV